MKKYEHQLVARNNLQALQFGKILAETSDYISSSGAVVKAATTASLIIR